MASESYFLLIVSDFHLSEGWDTDEERWHRLEDFRFDVAFSRFLRKQARIAREKDHRLRLIMAGDLVDFLQVMTIPLQKSFLGGDFHLQESPVTLAQKTVPVDDGFFNGTVEDCHETRIVATGLEIIDDTYAVQ